MTFKKGDPVQTNAFDFGVVIEDPAPFPKDEVWVELYPSGVQRFFSAHNLVKLEPARSFDPGVIMGKVESAMAEYMDKHEKWGKRLAKHTKGTPILNDLAVMITKKLTGG